MGILNIKSGAMYDGPGPPTIRVKTSVSTDRKLFQRLMDSRLGYGCTRKAYQAKPGDGLLAKQISKFRSLARC